LFSNLFYAKWFTKHVLISYEFLAELELNLVENNIAAAKLNNNMFCCFQNYTYDNDEELASTCKNATAPAQPSPDYGEAMESKAVNIN
jgi:hypothetical protein